MCPHFQNRKGIGAMAKVQKARTLDAQPAPSVLYSCSEKSGNDADRKYREIIAAPAAEAPYNGPYVSIMNRFAGAYMTTLAVMAKHWKRIGTIQ